MFLAVGAAAGTQAQVLIPAAITYCLTSHGLLVVAAALRSQTHARKAFATIVVIEFPRFVALAAALCSQP